MASFLLFGIYLGPVLADLTWPVVIYGVLSLVVFRMVAVVVALLGSGLERSSVLYLGWFGPRGLATLILSIEIARTRPGSTAGPDRHEDAQREGAPVARAPGRRCRGRASGATSPGRWRRAGR
jgi:NhaP-type Na+/H+ or K+/H+ antiporter